MADITTLNAATADINALEYLKRGMALIRDVDNCLRQNLASGAELASLNVAPVVPSPAVTDMLGIMAIYQGAYEQSHAQYPNTVTWVPGVTIETTS